MVRATPGHPESKGREAAPVAVPGWLASRWRLLTTLFLVLALPLGALSWLIAGRARGLLRRQAEHENQTIAVLIAGLGREHFDGLARYVGSFATRRMFCAAVAAHDIEGARHHLSELADGNPEFDRAFVTDPDGVEWADSSSDAVALGGNYAYRDWYQGARRAGTLYVSVVYERSGQPVMPVVAVATPLRDEQQQIIGYLVAQNPIESLRAWLRGVHPSISGGQVALIDRNGTVVGPEPSSDREWTRPTTAGTTLEAPDPITGAPSLLRLQSIDHLGWSALASQPLAAVVEPAETLGRTIAMLALLCFAIAFALGTAWLGAIRRAQAALAERSGQLAQLAADLEVTTGSVRRAHSELQQAHEELKRTEAQLVQAEKLSALGQMVAGIAHEINNPLAFVSNDVAVLRRDLEGLRQVIGLYQQAEATLAEHERALLDRIRTLADEIDLPYVLDNVPTMMARSSEGLRRIQRIVRDLRDFARLDAGDLASVDLNEGVELTLRIAQARAKERGVTLHSDLGALPKIQCFAAKVHQALLNLVVNAIDACERGGTVTVRTRPAHDGGALLIVEDNGRGIDPAIRGKIFDPFFTTKPVGQGTGLGLSISYGIARAHGGTIEVESEPGKGSRFTIRLPARPPDPQQLGETGRSWSRTPEEIAAGRVH
jgi:signal transduction histidine kinase